MTDPRVHRSQQRLRQALAELVVEQDYNSITIRAITQRAGVGYATFFRHYPDKTTLLGDLLERSIQDLIRLMPRGDEVDHAAEGRLIFEHVAQNERMFRILLKGKEVNQLLDRVYANASKELTARLPVRSQTAIPLEILLYNLITSVVGLIDWWLKHDRPYPPDEMGRIYADLLMQPFLERL